MDFNWSDGSPDSSIGADTFSVRWSGTIKPTYSEEYTFYLTADDGVRLWVDGKLLLNRWINQSGQLTSIPVKLQVGCSYDIQIEYFENAGGAMMGLYWSSASQAKQIVPQSQLNPPAEMAGTGLRAEYFNNMNLSGEPSVIRTDANINFNWSTNAPVSSIPADRFSVRWTGTIQPQYSESYTFYVWADDGVRLWVNDQLIMDRWQGQSGEFSSTAISLKAGQRYSLRMEYYEELVGAAAALSWSSSDQTKEVVPQSQLYLPYLTYSPQKYYYDANGRLYYIRLSDGTIIRYYYDTNGNLLNTSRE
ncbi:Protective antigen precursor [compost metagenome]